MVAADVREAPEDASGTKNIASGVDREIYAGNQRIFEGRSHQLVAALCIAYTTFHIGVMNLYPLETWVYRLAHVTGGLALGFTLFSARGFIDPQGRAHTRSLVELALLGIAALLILTALGRIALAVATGDLIATGAPPDKMVTTFGLFFCDLDFPAGRPRQARAWRSAPRPRRDCGGRLYHCPCAFPAHPRPGLPASQ